MGMRMRLGWGWEGKNGERLAEMHKIVVLIDSTGLPCSRYVYRNRTRSSMGTACFFPRGSGWKQEKGE